LSGAGGAVKRVQNKDLTLLDSAANLMGCRKTAARTEPTLFDK